MQLNVSGFSFVAFVVVVVLVFSQIEGTYLGNCVLENLYDSCTDIHRQNSHRLLFSSMVDCNSDLPLEKEGVWYDNVLISLCSTGFVFFHRSVWFASFLLD